MLAAPGAAATTTDHPILVSCTSTGQLCEPPAEVVVTTDSVLLLDFQAAETHCSDIRVHVTLDGVLVHTSAFLGPGQAMGPIDLGPVSSGEHTIGLQGEGRVGGCNTGGISGWGGTATTTTSEAPVPVPELASLALTLAGALAVVGVIVLRRRS